MPFSPTFLILIWQLIHGNVEYHYFLNRLINYDDDRFSLTNHDENGNAVTLDGNNAQTSPLIVATAIVNNIPPTDNWTQFKEDFRFIQPFSQDILENRGYSLAIVFSSSADGDFFQGAIGSTLCIDNVRIVCETEE